MTRINSKHLDNGSKMTILRDMAVDNKQIRRMTFYAPEKIRGIVNHIYDNMNDERFRVAWRQPRTLDSMLEKLYGKNIAEGNNITREKLAVTFIVAGIISLGLEDMLNKELGLE